MESKLNTLAIETYCSAFTDRVANDFFARHEKINGEQILKLSPVQQVNLFVIKNLFETWQQEASRLRSPYFNYSHPKVQEAQKVYMNTLSRHISISETDLKPLLHKAVRDALVLLVLPLEYIYTALKPSQGNPQEVEEILKYARINQAYMKEATSILNRQEVREQHWLESLLGALEAKEKAGGLQPENPAPYLQQFAEVLPLRPSEILQDQELGAGAPEEADFFSTITGNLREEVERTDSLEQSQSAPAPDENLPTMAEGAHRHAQLRREEPDLSNHAPKIEISRPTSADTKSRQGKTLNDQFEKDRKSLNEKLIAPAEKQSVAVQHKLKKSGSIRSGISLNHRFMFTNELFKGDTQAFNQALDQLDRFDSYKAAHAHAMQEYAGRYGWDREGEATQEFLNILQNRYR